MEAGLIINGMKTLDIMFGVHHSCPDDVTVDFLVFDHTNFKVDRLVVTVVNACLKACQKTEWDEDDEEIVRVGSAVEAKINAEFLRLADLLIGEHSPPKMDY